MIPKQTNDIKYHRGKDNTYNTQGSNSRGSKLTDEIVYKIKFEREGFSRQQIAEEFGIHINHVSHIRSGRRWGHIKR